MTGLPLWPPAAQARLYDAIGYRATGVDSDGQGWTRPAETDRFLYNWTERFHIVVCPRRASKSYAGAKKALPIVLGRAPKPDGSGPKPTRTWVVGPTYELAEKEFSYLWQDLKVELPKLGMPEPTISRFSKRGGDLYMLMPWGGEVVGKSADKPQSLLGEAVDCLLLAEAAQLPGDVWYRYLEPTLATTQGYAFFPTTPAESASWLHELWVKGLTGHPDLAVYSWPVTGNPVYPRSELERARRFYGEESPVYREQYLGEWTFYGGTVYGRQFDPSRNLIDAFPIPAHWRRIRAIDFGYRDPFVCLWFALVEEATRGMDKGSLVLYREYYQAGRAMADHAATIRRLTGEELIAYTVADSSEQQSISDLMRYGVACLDANRDRRAGRMAVGDYLSVGTLRFMKGTCPETLKELQFFKWDRDKDKEGSHELTLGNDHAMDAMRYAVMTRPTVRQPEPRVPIGSFAHERETRTQARVMQAWTAGVA